MPKFVVYRRSFKQDETGGNVGDVEYVEAAKIEGVRSPQNDLYETIDGETVCHYAFISDDISRGYEMDIVSNLPDVGCLTFMKSLFFMIGAFPVVNDKGDIVPLFYSDIKRNIAEGNVAYIFRSKPSQFSDGTVRHRMG